MKLLLSLIVLLMAFQSCSLIRKVNKKELKELSKKDSSYNSFLKIDSSNKRLDNSLAEGSKSNKSSISFIVDTSKKPTVINNYIQPSGNSYIDFMKWLAQNNLLKSGTIENSSDSNYKLLNSILIENKLLKESLDSAKSSEIKSKDENSKFTEKTFKVSVFSIIIFIVILSAAFIFLYKRYKITKIIKI